MKTCKNRIDLEEMINDFVIETNRRAVYNEISLQHELGIYLRERLSKIDNDIKVEFERNIEFFGINKKNWPKKEIDIVIYNNNEKNERYAIELKYHPIDCNVPQRMFDSIVDINFMQQLLSCGFKTYVLVITEEQKMFYVKNDRSKLDIYKYFRNQKPIIGRIKNNIKYSKKQRGPKIVTINSEYIIDWKDFKPSINESKELVRKYYFKKIKK